MNYKTPLSLRNFAAQSQNWLCFYCELPMGGKGSTYLKAIPMEKKRLRASAEHLRARQDGGRSSQANVVAAHVFCNQFRHKAKCAKSPAEFATLVKSRVAKNKWFKGSELNLLVHAVSYLRPGVGDPQFRPADNGHPVALRPLKNPS